VIKSILMVIVTGCSSVEPTATTQQPIDPCTVTLCGVAHIGLCQTRYTEQLFDAGDVAHCSTEWVGHEDAGTGGYWLTCCLSRVCGEYSCGRILQFASEKRPAAE
jgi:hypothetical protein